MEVFETYFVRNGSEIYLDKAASAGSIKTASFSDCFLDNRPIEPNDDFISPGIVVQQSSGEIQGWSLDHCPMFKHRTDHILRNFQIEGSLLFAYDAIGTAYIFTAGDVTPEKYEIGRRPIGWKPIPKTKTFIYWTTLALFVYSAENATTKTLRAHTSKVTAVDTSVSVTVTGSSTGRICIWYNSEFKCHHNISTGLDAVNALVIINNDVFVLTTTQLKKYNLETGQLQGSIFVHATSAIKLGDGLLLSDGRQIAFFNDLKTTACVKCSHYKLVSAEEDSRFFVLTNKGVVECDWFKHDWPLEAIDWINTPEFPFDKKWPKNTSLDLLASTADLWIPRTVYLDLPKEWFRHELLRDAIWDAVIKNDIDVSYNWLFLTPHIMKSWYQKNKQALIEIVKCPDYNYSAVVILNRIYQHIDIYNLEIQSYCWRHHQKKAFKHINMYLLQQTPYRHFEEIIKEVPSCAAATLLTTKAVRAGIKEGYVAIYLRWLRKYHQEIPVGPNHHMKQIFKIIVSYIYSSLEQDTMSLPLKESGQWQILKRYSPAHLGAYIRQRSLDGHITNIEFHPEVKVKWKPCNSAIELTLTDLDTIDIWKYYHTDGPNTMLECALTCLSKDIWQGNSRRVPFVWPSSEIAALEQENISIRVFEEPMRIISSISDTDGIKLKTSTGLEIKQEEALDIVCICPLWSYYDDQMYHIIPLKLKICSEIVKKMGNRSQVSVLYAKELISTLQFKTVDKEHRHRTPERVTACTHSLDTLFVGLVSGEILEYESSANFIPMRHFIKHTEPIQKISALDTRLITMCEDEMNVWSLHSGCLIFGRSSGLQYVSCVMLEVTNVWVIEKGEGHARMQLWDMTTELVIKSETFPCTGKLFTTDSPAIITENRCISLKENRREYELDIMMGEITCVCATYNGICGGTDYGIVFVVDELNNDIHHWSNSRQTAITAVAAMGEQPYVITGTEYGEIMIWKIDSEDTDIVGIEKICPYRIDHISFDNMFAVIVHRQNIQLLSVVIDRCVLAVDALTKCMAWSSQWKRRLIKESSKLLQPAVETCILQRTGMTPAMELLLEATEEYGDRLKWCNREFIDILMDSDPKKSRLVLKRLASFSGPKLECVICNQTDGLEKICYLKPCQHRFHLGCIRELIRKTPEYHHEMQQEYALHVTLKCPTCREPFVATDVCEDRFLNQHFSEE